MAHMNALRTLADALLDAAYQLSSALFLSDSFTLSQSYQHSFDQSSL